MTRAAFKRLARGSRSPCLPAGFTGCAGNASRPAPSQHTVGAQATPDDYTAERIHTCGPF